MQTFTGTSGSAFTWEDGRASLEQVNRRFAVVRVGGRTSILDDSDPTIFEFMGVESFRTFLKNQFLIYEDHRGNHRSRPLADLWLESPDRRTFSGIVFEPSGEHPPGTYNLWQGFRGVRPVSGSFERIDNHLREIITGRDETAYGYLLGWLAHMIQKPGEKPGVAVALRGRKGTGKGIFVSRIVGGVVGESLTVHVDKPEHLTGKFNRHLWGKILIFADEAFFAGDKRSVGTINALITERDTLLEAKGLDPVPVRSVARVIFATNEDWVVRASDDERRFFILDVSPAVMQDRAYFTALAEAIPEELPGFAYMLASLDLSEFDPFNCPKTDALQDQVEYSLDPFEQWAREVKETGQIVLRSGPSGQEVERVLVDLKVPNHEARCSEVHESYLQFALRLRETHPLGPTPFGRKLANRFDVNRKRAREGELLVYKYVFRAEPEEELPL